jgi:hypothetical protein
VFSGCTRLRCIFRVVGIPAGWSEGSTLIFLNSVRLEGGGRRQDNEEERESSKK